ncbi:tetratricopeptide repeat protein [Streptomyces sp. NBC_01288]|uniref:tetratricopeptide repeat protein n=1 Tax=Streptomyces sp. NBC_01288 TaxID=2903814 RepID=UPI002E164B02|nr:tetratricopeptide repeat protein [Streptomyces sp. NBC_01288]
MATAALPGVPPGFTGRDEDLARLFPVLDPAAESDLPVVICAVSGLGGIGKTSLALCAAHKAVRDGWFPGGTLFVDFRGYDADPVTADQAVVALLDGMGVRGADLPRTTAGQYGLYLRLLADEPRSMLLLLDNTSDAGQVMPLIPGTDRHRVLVTSRDRLTDLDAQLIDLDVLNAEDAADLIDRSLRLSDRADDRATREPEAVSELATLCGHHPLALRITAGMLRKRRHRSVASLVNELRGAEDRTAAVGLRPVFEAAYRQLPSAQARLLRLLSLAPAAEVGGETAAALADLSVDRTFDLLEALAAAHLVTPVPRGADVRWRLHDLVRAFGAGVVKGDAGLWEEGEGARERMLEFYHRWAEAADDRLRWLPGMPVPELFADRAGALAWFDGERAGLVAAVQWAREERYTDTAVRLSQCLGEYLNWRRSFDDWITVCGVAREAAHHTGNQVPEAIAWNNFGVALRQTGRTEEAIDAHTRARALYQAAGEPLREASAWNNLGAALSEAGRVEEAIDAHTRARDLYQAVGAHHREAKAWDNLGTALRQADRAEEAIDAHTRARDLYQAVGDRHREASAWNNLGAPLRETGRMEEAVEAYEKALEGYREFDDWYETGRTLSNLAHAHADAARPTEARTHYLQSAAAYTRANAPTEAAAAQSRADALT